jgi:hypothetical protein
MDDLDLPEQVVAIGRLARDAGMRDLLAPDVPAQLN